MADWQPWLALVLVACGNGSPPPPSVPPAPAPSADAVAPRVPSGDFVRTCSWTSSVEECACLGRGGYQCGEAFRLEKDPVVRRFMLRMVEAEARVRRDDFARNWCPEGQGPGVPHAEQGLFCKDSGPCGDKNDPDKPLDGGYACLTAAAGVYVSGCGEASSNADALQRLERACKCDLPNARVPVMGGYGLIACDEDGKPREFGVPSKMELALANEIRACAECEAKDGRKSCQAEVDRLFRADPELARYIATVHAPRCQTTGP